MLSSLGGQGSGKRFPLWFGKMDPLCVAGATAQRDACLSLEPGE